MGMNDEQRLAGSSLHPGDSGDTHITADRYELKYVLVPELAHGLLVDVARHLLPHMPPHLDSRDEPDSRADVEQHITTVYLDTPNRDIYRACLAGEGDEKLRIKEYRPSASASAASTVWIEVKKSCNSRSQKHRLPVPKALIDGALEAGELSLETLLAADNHSSHAREFLQRLWRIQRRYRRPLHATCVVHYSRTAWQDRSGELRITVDRDLRVSALSPDGPRDVEFLPWHGPDAPARGAMLLEVKHRGALPRWLASGLEPIPAACLPQQPARPFSKFLAASHAV